jgi:hypothetical protein
MLVTLDVFHVHTVIEPSIVAEPKLKLAALKNILAILVTLDVFQLPIFWLNNVALLNILPILITLDVIQLEILISLKFEALLNTEFILTTFVVINALTVVKLIHPLNALDKDVNPISPFIAHEIKEVGWDVVICVIVVILVLILVSVTIIVGANEGEYTYDMGPEVIGGEPSPQSIL